MLKSVTATCALALSRQAWADAYPSRPIKFVVTVAAGGGTDLIARVSAEYLAQILGQPVIVENQAGAGGQIGAQNTARAEPDGYSLMLGYVSTHGTLPAFKKVPYDSVRDFTPIGMIGGAPNVLVCAADNSERSFEEFIADAKRNPGKFSYGSAGNGSITHLVFEQLKLATGISIVHIPYRGIGPALNDLLGRQIQYSMPGLAGVVSHIEAGRLRALAVTGLRRHRLLPNVPTLAELGINNFEAVQWVGVMGPAKIPLPIVDRLNAAILDMLARPDFSEKLAGIGIDVMPMSASEFGAYAAKDLAKWRKVVQESGLKMES